MSHVDTAHAVAECFNRRDFEGMRALIAEDCLWIDGRGETYHGKDGFAAYSQAWAGAFSDGQITDSRYYDAGDTVVTEFVGRGTHDGQLGSIPATGKRAELPYLEVYHFDGQGKVRGGRAYFDQLTLLTQLGVISGIPAQAKGSKAESAPSL
jgi:steroid delta-isomerase-like uncharacterized protein